MNGAVMVTRRAIGQDEVRVVARNFLMQLKM